MKYIALLAIAVCGLTAACTVYPEKTVVQQPAAAPAPTVV